MPRPLVLLAIMVALGTGAAAQPADADDEGGYIAGYWLVWFFSSTNPCLMFVERDGGDLSAGLVCLGANGVLEGHVFEDGAFDLTRDLSTEVTQTISGQVSKSGRTLDGTWVLRSDADVEPQYLDGPLNGERSVPRWADMNCDGSVNSLDALYVLVRESEDCVEYLTVQAVPVDNFWAQGADVNLDNTIGSRDALLILQLDAGLIERLPVL